MKRRIAIAGALTILIFIAMPIALILLNMRGQGIFMISAILSLVMVGIYVFGGLPKLIIATIYGVFTALFLFLLTRPYHLPIIIIGTLLYVLNPLSSFQTYLENKLNKEDVLPIRISIRGSYWPFYAYRKEMKNYYHLPQARKLYTQKWYLHLRQLTTLSLVFLGTFIFILGINFIANTLEDFNWYNFFVFYTVIILFIMAWLSYKKGFTSTFRTLVLSLFPTIIYLVFMSNFTWPIKWIIASSVFVIGIVVSIIELVKFYHRAVYDSYHYYDVDQQREVFANALFESLVYNEPYCLSGYFKIKVKLTTFQKHFQDILVYSNYFRIIITAYSYGQEMVHLYADFHRNGHKRAEKFKTYLEAKFNISIPMDLKDDPDKTLYEKNFFHRPGYIIARAQSLANLLKELEIKTKIMISMIVYFELEDELEAFSEEFDVVPLESLSEEDYLTVRVDIPSLNVDYMIEAKIREVLLALMVHHGKFVRINVYYS